MRTLLILLLTAFPLAAQPVPNPLPLIEAGKWPEALAASARLGDPAARKLVLWYRLLTPNAATATEIATFARQNPDWPLPTLTERRRQEAIARENDAATAAALCMEKTPTQSPARGAALLRCAEALSNTGKQTDAARVAREAWVAAIADPAAEAAFVRRFPGLITPADQFARFQRLAWDNAEAARRQIAYLDPARAGRAAARLALKADATGYSAPPAEEPGAMLDLARAYRHLNQNGAAVALWRDAGPAAQKAAPDRLDMFWSERHQLARKLLHDGDPAGAYAVVAAHGQADPVNIVEAEFLAGFIALRKLNDPGKAARHFTALAAASPAVLTQSRAYYWLGRTKTAAGGDGKAEFNRAASWPMTFYGQLASREAGQPGATLSQALRAPPEAVPGLPASPAMTELAHDAKILLSWNDPRRARQFLMRMEEIAGNPAARIAVGDYATALGLPDIAVLVTRRLGRDGIVPPMQGWPTPYEPPPVLEQAVSLAIMRQESNFDLAIVSPSGARGLMQLMPATASLVARRLGEPTSLALLTGDPQHNMRMGTAYLREVLDKFDNSVPLAAAAYNAGPNRVTRWLADNGDPRAEPSAMIDWIEMIPFNETRNYVQRVLENAVIYQARRTGTLPIAMTQWSR